MRDRLDAALTAGTAVPPPWIAAVAAYFPLPELGAADALLARSWPAPIAALLDQQIREPREEAALRAAIPQLTPIEDDVSRAVQAQYEANPYPRWITARRRRGISQSIDTYLRETFPAATFRRSARAAASTS